MSDVDLPLPSVALGRLSSQLLSQPSDSPPELVVAWLGGVQAQDYRWAKWSVGLRMPGATDADVERAVAERRIVRTWAFRGTLHFVAADDVRWLLRLLAPRVIASNARRYRQLELDEDTLARSNDAIGRVLDGGRELIRSELAEALEAAGISVEGQRIFYMVQRAALDAVICHGPMRGSKPTFVLLADWLDAVEDADPEAADSVLATRYVNSHGPATVQDFAWWAGLPVSAARGALCAVPAIERTEVDGVERWGAVDRTPVGDEDTAHLLPPYDDYLLGYKDRSAVLDPTVAKSVNAGGGMPKPALVVDGQVVGTWRRESRGGAIAITLEPFRTLSARDRALIADAARRYGGFAGRPVDLQVRST